MATQSLTITESLISQLVGTRGPGARPSLPSLPLAVENSVLIRSTCLQTRGAFGPKREELSTFWLWVWISHALGRLFLPQEMSQGASPAIMERNIFSHRATPVVNKHLLPIYLSSMGEGDCVGLGHFFGNAGPTAPGKASQSLCYCLGSGVAPGNSCCVSIET